jgi:hypothetical protein
MSSSFSRGQGRRSIFLLLPPLAGKHFLSHRRSPVRIWLRESARQILALPSLLYTLDIPRSPLRRTGGGLESVYPRAGAGKGKCSLSLYPLNRASISYSNRHGGSSRAYLSPQRSNGSKRLFISYYRIFWLCVLRD